MKSKSQEAALLAVKALQVELTAMIRARDHRNRQDICYYSMEEIEGRLKTCLEEVDKIDKEHDLNDTIPLEFKKEATEKIYAAAMERRDYKWAASFAKKYEI